MQTAVQFRYERLAPLLSVDDPPTLDGAQAPLAAAEVQPTLLGYGANSQCTCCQWGLRFAA